MTRPLSRTDIQTIAEYLVGTNEILNIALSELGFDPRRYSLRKFRRWLLEEADVIQCRRTGTWMRHDL